MANIVFQNTGFAVNPGLEDVLDPNGVIGTHTATEFEIVNTSGGQFNGYRFVLLSSGGEFIYSGTTPTGGDIDGIAVLAPNGITHIIDVGEGDDGFGDARLTRFFNNLHDANGDEPGLFLALDALLENENSIIGSIGADHITTFGAGYYPETLEGGSGNDILWARNSDGYHDDLNIVGGAGNDTIRIDGYAYNNIIIHGALSTPGTAAVGETNILELRSDEYGSARFAEITDINALRFVDTSPNPQISETNLDVEFDINQIGAGLLSLTLAISGSTTVAPNSQNTISIFRHNLNDVTPVNLDLSDWTFTNWVPEQSRIDIVTNSVVSDHIIGTSVADYIETLAGNDSLDGGGGDDDLYAGSGDDDVEGGDGGDDIDAGVGDDDLDGGSGDDYLDAGDGDDTLRGGAGNDDLNGGRGDDTFVFYANEGGDEYIDGGYDDAATSTDKIVVHGDNNFFDAYIGSIDQFVFRATAKIAFSNGTLGETLKFVGDSHANDLVFNFRTSGTSSFANIDLSGLTFESWTGGEDTISIVGTRSKNIIAGSDKSDTIRGKGGNDDLQGNDGNDRFVFDTKPGSGVAHIADFEHNHDRIVLDHDAFAGLRVGDLTRAAFAHGVRAHDRSDRIIYDEINGVLRYDFDGTGNHRALIIAVLDTAPHVTAADLVVV